MAESATHLLQTAPGVRLWLATELEGAEDWAAWLADGEAMLNKRAAAADMVVGGGRGSTRRVVFGADGNSAAELDATTATVKHGVWRINRHGGLLGGLQGNRYRSPRRLKAELDLSEALRTRGIDTPRVLLALAVKRGLSWRQHLVTEEVPGAVTVFDAREQTAALQAADTLLDQLCDVGLWATDLHPGNMLWQADAGRCWVIDLAGAKLMPRPLTEPQRFARRQRFARYFAKHGGSVPELFAGRG